MFGKSFFLYSLYSLFSFTISRADETVDPHMWLEEVGEEKALEWVKEQNKKSVDTIAVGDDFTQLQLRLQDVYNSEERIPYAEKKGEFYYNFWRDEEHTRGVWRRTTLEHYRSENPEWEIILDLDALAKTEDENWVWHGANCLMPEEIRCMIALSKGGSDADVKREFDVTTKSFLDEGFFLPEAKSRISWIDENTLLVGTNFGEGTLTDSGYPMIAKKWSRGTELEDANIIMEGKKEDISVGSYYSHEPNYEKTVVYQGLTFYTNRVFLQGRKGLVQIEKQDSANASFWKDNIFLELREDWTVNGTTYKSGSLITAPLKPWLKGKKKIDVLFEPTESTSLSYFTTTKDYLILATLDHVKSKIKVLAPSKKQWTEVKINGIPEFGRLRLTPADSYNSNDYWLTVRDFITPDSLYMGNIEDGSPEKIKSLPPMFDAQDLQISQHFATSKDGTSIPYFQVAHKDTPLDSSNPTLLYGYGGFEISLLPYYSASVGIGWLEKGGVYVVANIRGGGEYGPRWHQAALKENRHKAYEDFAAVGEDLVSRKISAPEKIGIQGGSNGGLLMGNMYTLYPDHWGAIVCQVPLLDMKRYTKLLAGASWAGEYGDPDIPEQWAYIKTFSPYHNINKEEEDYPPILITTSTRDDRVHPAHARKMTAALEDAEKNVLYYENIEGGHGGSANNEQAAFMSSLAYMFLWNQLHETSKNNIENENSLDENNLDEDTTK